MSDSLTASHCFRGPKLGGSRAGAISLIVSEPIRLSGCSGHWQHSRGRGHAISTGLLARLTEAATATSVTHRSYRFSVLVMGERHKIRLCDPLLAPVNIIIIIMTCTSSAHFHLIDRGCY